MCLFYSKLWHLFNQDLCVHVCVYMYMYVYSTYIIIIMQKLGQFGLVICKYAPTLLQ